MTTSASATSSTSMSNTASVSDDWSKYVPKEVTAEDSLSQVVSKTYWARIYQKVGAHSEEAQKAIRCAIYVYHAINGTSRAGDYSNKVVASNGVAFDSSITITVVGKFNLRKFMRSNMYESVEFYKKTGVLSLDARYVQKLSRFGIPADKAYVAPDWLDNCPLLTPAEQDLHDNLFKYSNDRARNARGGKSLEEVEHGVTAAVIGAGTTDTDVKSDQW